MPEIIEKEVYTSKEVEDLLKISSSTLKRLIKQGMINVNKIGGQYRFLGSEILRIVSPSIHDRARDAYRIVKTKAKEATRNW